jgi:hypothetical protein
MSLTTESGMQIDFNEQERKKLPSIPCISIAQVRCAIAAVD